jgi:Neuraminidase (sialidase)
VAGSIDAGTEDGAWSSVDAGATWTDAIADPSEAATQDQYYLLPGWNADTADIQLIFWDASADEISVKRYDDSANSWAEEVIATGMVDTVATTSYPHLAAFVDLENSQNVVAAWSAKDTAGADLRIWTITDTTITEKTNVILDSVDDQGFVALCKDINTNYWYCIYAGKSDGSDTFASNVGIYYKFSTDGGTTWSEEQKASEGQVNIAWLVTIPRFTGSLVLAYYSNYTIPEIYINRDVGSQRAHYQLGV